MPRSMVYTQEQIALSEELHEVFSKIEYGELEVPRKFSFLEN